MDDIAVVGIGLRFPGDASSPEELWKVLEKGESQWQEFPKDRLNIDGYYHPSGDRQGSVRLFSEMVIRLCSWLIGEIDILSGRTFFEGRFCCF